MLRCIPTLHHVKAAMVGKVGDDSIGAETFKNFQSLNINTDHLTTTTEAASGVAPIFVGIRVRPPASRASLSFAPAFPCSSLCGTVFICWLASDVQLLLSVRVWLTRIIMQLLLCVDHPPRATNMLLGTRRVWREPDCGGWRCKQPSHRRRRPSKCAGNRFRHRPFRGTLHSVHHTRSVFGSSLQPLPTSSPPSDTLTCLNHPICLNCSFSFFFLPL